jgi:hypothetical protein
VSARITPYEFILESMERELFPAIRAEAEHRGSSTRRRDEFVLLGHVGAALRGMVPEDAPPAALDEYAELLFHGYSFWESGRRLYVLDDALLQQLTTPRLTLSDWELAAPPSCYMQFPSQRLWARVAGEAPWEPADGCFVALDDDGSAGDDPAELRVLLVLGMRAERPGVSLIAHHATLDARSAMTRASAPWRGDAEPFAAAIPGAELKGLRTLATTSELEALVLRTLHWVDRHAPQLQPGTPSEAANASRLPHVLARGD